MLVVCSADYDSGKRFNECAPGIVEVNPMEEGPSGKWGL